MTAVFVTLAIVFVAAAALWFFEIDVRLGWHTRDTSRFADPLWARFDAAMDKATKERKP